MPASSFQNKKELLFVIRLATGTFGSSNANTISLKGFRASIEIDKAGGNQMGTLHARIYGVSESDVNAITTLYWKQDLYNPNTVTVTAIDGDQQTQVFYGNIVQAWGNYLSQPDVFLQIQAQTAYAPQLTPVPPVSFKGSVTADVVLTAIVKQMPGFTIENNGVTTPLSNPYFSGTALDQLKGFVRAVNCDLYFDDTVVAICPRYLPRQTQSTIPLISPQSGLIGYPSFDGNGLNFRCLFAPAIKFGGSVALQTSIPKANGQFTVLCVGHQLESEKPGGAWYSIVKGINNAIAGA